MATTSQDGIITTESPVMITNTKEYLDLGESRKPLDEAYRQGVIDFQAVSQVLVLALDSGDMTLFLQIREELRLLLQFVLENLPKDEITELTFGFLPAVYANGYFSAEELEAMGFMTGFDAGYNATLDFHSGEPTEV